MRGLQQSWQKPSCCTWMDVLLLWTPLGSGNLTVRSSTIGNVPLQKPAGIKAYNDFPIITFISGHYFLCNITDNDNE